MTQHKTRYKAEIANNTYTIIGTETKQHMDTVTELVNMQLQDILDLSPETDLEQGAILLAINAISDQVKKQKEILSLEEQITEMTEKVKQADELAAKVERFEAMEAEAREALQENGELPKDISPSEAQKIANKKAIEKIAKKNGN